MSMTLAQFAAHLFVAAQATPPSNGARFERRVVDFLTASCVPVEQVPGATSLYGMRSASGLAHQLDVTARLSDVDVTTELKSYDGVMRKNDLLRFVAATDDFYVGLGTNAPTRRLFRVFCGRGSASWSVRMYAALHGVAMVEGTLWPAVLLSSPYLTWPADVEPPDETDRALLGRLIRPVQEVLCRTADGRFLTEPHAALRCLPKSLAVQEWYSIRLWASLDSRGLEPSDVLGFDRRAA